MVAAGLARRCTIQLSYAIGVAEPLSIYVDLHGTGTVEDSRIEAAIPGLVRLTPKGIRTHLGLTKPISRQTAAYGHFDRTAEGDAFTWSTQERRLGKECVRTNGARWSPHPSKKQNLIQPRH